MVVLILEKDLKEGIYDFMNLETLDYGLHRLLTIKDKENAFLYDEFNETLYSNFKITKDELIEKEYFKHNFILKDIKSIINI